ncbi:thiamine-phosphate kinase [Timonella sp. A28]|uniref:thiamine-phosphate kinase n=1 Tax=Timonella sp. A28 TaxID=3442640 RepID=UPI003EB97E80
MTLADLDEAQLLAQVFPLLTTNSYVVEGPGDDCAVVAVPSGQFVVSTDILVEDVHFKRQWSSAYEIGWRAAMQNLADIAAMGAQPITMTVGLGLPKTTAVAWVKEFFRGLSAACTHSETAIVGGDLSSAPTVFISVTVHGVMPAGIAPVLRSGAQAGDVVAHCGLLGWSQAGFEDLMGSKDAHTKATELFKRPAAPVRSGVAAAQAGATAQMDVSDGLLLDAQRMARASNVHIELNVHDIVSHGDNLPVEYANDYSSELQDETMLADKRQQLQWKLTGGEDHGILATFPTDTVLPEGFVVIGAVRELNQTEHYAAKECAGEHEKRPRSDSAYVTVQGTDIGGLALGWDHFR